MRPRDELGRPPSGELDVKGRGPPHLRPAGPGSGPPGTRAPCLGQGGEPLGERPQELAVGAVVQPRSPALGGGPHGDEHGHARPARQRAAEPDDVPRGRPSRSRPGVEQVGAQLDDVGPGLGGGAPLRQAGRSRGAGSGHGDRDAPVVGEQAAQAAQTTHGTGTARDRAIPSRMSCRLVTAAASGRPAAVVSATTREITSLHTSAPAAMTSRRPGRR